MSSKQHSMLYTALASLCTPVVEALDGMAGSGEGDSGQALPSQRDMSLRIVLGGICQNVHNQLYGEIISGNGQKLPNIKNRLDDSEERVANIGDRLRDDMLTNADMKAIEWLKVNEARYGMYHEILSAASTLYADVTGESWKPYIKDDAKAAAKTVSADQKEKLMALMARKSKVPPATPEQQTAAA